MTANTEKALRVAITEIGTHDAELADRVAHLVDAILDDRTPKWKNAALELPSGYHTVLLTNGTTVFTGSYFSLYSAFFSWRIGFMAEEIGVTHWAEVDWLTQFIPKGA